MIRRSPRKELFLFYYKRANVFTDCDGHIIYNIFRIISPNDLYLFRHRPKHNTFKHCSQDNVLCRIITVMDDEDYYWDEQDVLDHISRDFAKKFLEGEQL